MNIELTVSRDAREHKLVINGEDVSQYVTAAYAHAHLDGGSVSVTFAPDVAHVTIEGDEPPDIYFFGDGMKGYQP